MQSGNFIYFSRILWLHLTDDGNIWRSTWKFIFRKCYFLPFAQLPRERFPLTVEKIKFSMIIQRTTLLQA